MYFFIAIIFIAELIVTAFIISLIVKADRAVLRLNGRVVKSREKIIKSFATLKNSVVYVEKGIDWVLGYVKRKREEYLLKVTKTIIIYALLFMLEMSFCNSKKCRGIITASKALLKRFLA